MQQLVVVLTQTFSDSEGTLFAFEEGEEPLFAFPIVVGEKGMAWGRGHHRYWHLSGLHKREGDNRAPAGLFSLSALFGKEELREARMPFLRSAESHFCIDDPHSTFYNVIVDAHGVANDWKSAEEMVRNDGLYDLGVVIDHNADPVTPGMGSCIFMHRWREEGWSTAGCTAMSSENLVRLCSWLDSEKDPHLFQVPREGYSSLLSSLRVEESKIAVTKRVGKLMRA